MILLLLIDVLRPLYSNAGIWRTKANGASYNSDKSLKRRLLSNVYLLFLSSDLTIAQLIYFFAGSLRAVVGEGRGSQKLARDFMLGGGGAHEESFMRIQFVSRHIDGSRWTDQVIYSGEISFLCSLFILFVLHLTVQKINYV